MDRAAVAIIAGFGGMAIVAFVPYLRGRIAERRALASVPAHRKAGA